MDRFFFKLKMGFPSIDALHDIVERTTQHSEPKAERVLDQQEILQMRETARRVPIARPVQDYAIRMTLATHPHDPNSHTMVRQFVRFGSSPRGVQALVLGAKVHALMNGRIHVAGEDIRAIALPALRHRLLLNYEGEAERVDTDTIIVAIIDSLAPPAAE